MTMRYLAAGGGMNVLPTLMNKISLRAGSLFNGLIHKRGET